jgi:hypothetical protein
MRDMGAVMEINIVEGDAAARPRPRGSSKRAARRDMHGGVAFSIGEFAFTGPTEATFLFAARLEGEH